MNSPKENPLKSANFGEQVRQNVNSGKEQSPYTMNS